MNKRRMATSKAYWLGWTTCLLSFGLLEFGWYFDINDFVLFAVFFALSELGERLTQYLLKERL